MIWIIGYVGGLIVFCAIPEWFVDSETFFKASSKMPMCILESCANQTKGFQFISSPWGSSSWILRIRRGRDSSFVIAFRWSLAILCACIKPLAWMISVAKVQYIEDVFRS